MDYAGGTFSVVIYCIYTNNRVGETFGSDRCVDGIDGSLLSLVYSCPQIHQVPYMKYSQLFVCQSQVNKVAF